MTQRCAMCTAPLSYLVDDGTPYEVIDPLDGGPRLLIAHTDERCGFHRFLTPELQARQSGLLRKRVRATTAGVRWERWVRDDQPVR